MRLTDFLNDLDRPVVYYPALTKITGGVKETILLCQLIYWTGKQHNPEGWIYKTQEEILEETGLSRTEQENARRNLRKNGFIEERFRGIPRKLYFKVNIEAVNEAWDKYRNSKQNKVPENGLPDEENSPANNNAGNLHSIMQETCIIECGKPANKNAGNLHAITEITTENTTEMTSEKKDKEDNNTVTGFSSTQSSTSSFEDTTIRDYTLHFSKYVPNEQLFRSLDSKKQLDRLVSRYVTKFPLQRKKYGAGAAATARRVFQEAIQKGVDPFLILIQIDYWDEESDGSNPSPWTIVDSLNGVGPWEQTMQYVRYSFDCYAATRGVQIATGSV